MSNLIGLKDTNHRTIILYIRCNGEFAYSYYEWQ